MAKAMLKSRGKGELEPYGAWRMPSALDEMDRLLNRFFGRKMGGPAGFGKLDWPEMGWPEKFGLDGPSVDIYEEGDSLVVKAELPGVRKEDLDVKVTGDTITISGEKKKEEDISEKGYHRVERSWGSFTRTLAFPTEVQSAKAEAKFTDGVLEVKVPKTTEARKKERKVKIS